MCPPAPVWYSLSHALQHQLHLPAHPALQPHRAAPQHGDPEEGPFPVQVRTATLSRDKTACVTKRDLIVRPTFCRDIAKNCLLRWRIFIYWTFLGLFDSMVFFFGAYFLFDNTTFTSNGQVRSLGPGEYALATARQAVCAGISFGFEADVFLPQ